MNTPDPVLEAYLSGDDEAFIRELSLNSIEMAFRPRDEWDVDVHPESLRGQVLAYRDAQAELWAKVPWWLRLAARIVAWFRR